MRIAIDASRTTVARVTGTEQYALQLIRALIRLNTEHHITLYFNTAPPPGLFPASPLVEQRIIPQRRLWTQTRFAAALWHDQPDVTWVPAHALPLLFPGRAVVTVHDLGFHYFPQAHPWWPRLYLNLSTRASVRRARVILADSRATADDLTRLFGVPQGKIRVVYPGVDAPQPGSIDAVHARYGLPDRYFLFIGTLQPRKNIARLVQAYARWQTAHPDNSVGLVLAGGKGWLFDPAWVNGVDNVVLTGYIDDDAKGALYAGAEALVFPSLYEGFGFPALEAMHCGTPVIASQTSSLGEIVADAGLLVDPLDVDAIAGAMSAILDNPQQRAELVARGRVQAARFTWDAAARSVMAALEHAAG